MSTRAEVTRRGLLRQLIAGAFAAAALGCRQRQSVSRGPHHPEPRPRIDASRVVRATALATNPEAARVFEMVREMPKVCDAIRCHCNCAVTYGLRSLLACFEDDGMAQDCELCLKEAERVYSLHRNGKSVAEIRALVDAAFI